MNLLKYKIKNTHNFVKTTKKTTGKVSVGFTFINILLFFIKSHLQLLDNYLIHWRCDSLRSLMFQIFSLFENYIYHINLILYSSSQLLT